MNYSPPTLNALRYARVQMRVGAAQLLAVQLTAGGAVTPVGSGPGVRQDDAVQLVTDLAVARSVVTWGTFTESWVYKGGKFLGRGTPGRTVAAGEESIPVVGVEPLAQRVPPGKGAPDDWGITIALACERAIDAIADSQRSAELPLGYSAFGVPAALPLPLAAVIVGGVAASVVGAVAAWRYLDPEARHQLAAIEAASVAYRTRIAAWRETGTMPEVTAIEQTTAEAVTKLASKTRTSGWLIGAGVAGGVALGAGAAAWVGRAASR